MQRPTHTIPTGANSRKTAPGVRVVRSAGVLATFLAAALTAGLPVVASAQDETVSPKARQPWTLEEALGQLKLYPRDAYLQYVTLQLAHREGKLDEVGPTVEQILWLQNLPNNRPNDVDLFNLFSGALAVQESLQLDTMRGRRPGVRSEEPMFRARNFIPPAGNDTAVRRQRAAAERRRAEIVALSELTGPTIKSHPWTEMLAGKRPEVSSLSKAVPDDFYFAKFRSLNKLLAVVDDTDLWSTHLFSQAAQEAQTQLVGQRLQRQLAVESNDLLRPFYDTVVGEVAVTGSDLFYREGSDITLLFEFTQPAIFKSRMDGFLKNAEDSDPAIRRTTERYLGVDYIHLAAPDRSVHVYSAYPKPGLHVRSNSRPAFERVIEAIHGTTADGRPVRRLGDTDEFAYIRTLMPANSENEDGFVYLSDPFIRHLVGPQLKLTERRRMLCYNHLRMINHAAELYRTEHGKPASSLAELTRAGCTPGTFGEGLLQCPDGGTYHLSDDGLTGVCSHHGHAGSLRPCCELDLAQVTRGEAEDYEAFLNQYNRYWRTFFDPIALRIQATPQKYRVETIVLPLMDNSIYSGLATALGGAPENLDALPVPQRNIFSFAVRINKEELIRQAGLEQYLQQPATPSVPETAANLNRAATAMKQLGLALHNYHDAHSKFPATVSFDDAGKKTKLSWRVHLLPFLDEIELYQRFHLDEPWDSAHNKKLVAQMPDLYRPDDEKLAKAGKTRFVAPLGDTTLFPIKKQERGIRDITDGTSNTIMLAEADDEHSVIWTKPDDLVIDLEQPSKDLAMRPPGAFLVLFADGVVRFQRKTINRATLAAQFTRAGGEVIETDDRDTIPLRLPNRRSRRGFWGMPVDAVDGKKLAAFLAHGIGNQVGMHIYDADPLFDFSLPAFLGQAVGNFNGGNGFGRIDEGMMIGVLIASLNSPVYLSMPVQDGEVVDVFLDELDRLLAQLARAPQRGGFFQVRQDFYHLPVGPGQSARGYAFQLGPVKWRFFWARIGDGLYIASQPFILEDLLAMHRKRDATAPDNPAEPAHAMVRMRPQNWDRVLRSFQLGWEENNRQACLKNLGPITSLRRGLTSTNRDNTGRALPDELYALTARIYDTHFYCPDGGHYHLDPDGKTATCDIHGSATSPRQLAAPTSTTGIGKLLGAFSDMKLWLTFHEEGLHAVVEINRK